MRCLYDCFLAVLGKYTCFITNPTTLFISYQPNTPSSKSMFIKKILLSFALFFYSVSPSFAKPTYFPSRTPHSPPVIILSYFHHFFLLSVATSCFLPIIQFRFPLKPHNACLFCITRCIWVPYFLLCDRHAAHP